MSFWSLSGSVRQWIRFDFFLHLSLTNLFILFDWWGCWWNLLVIIYWNYLAFSFIYLTYFCVFLFDRIQFLFLLFIQLNIDQKNIRSIILNVYVVVCQIQWKMMWKTLLIGYVSIHGLAVAFHHNETWIELIKNRITSIRSISSIKQIGLFFNFISS